MEKGKNLYERYYGVLAFVFLFSFLAAAAAGESASDLEQRIAPGPVLIQVKSNADNKPVSQVLVFLGARYAHSDNNGTLILDGVPAGDYLLRVEQPGFERYERSVQVPPGKRNPIEIGLTPVITVYTQGQVLESETGFPLAGAQIEVRPVDVKAAVKGKLNFFTDWEGRFKILGIPSGRYHLEILAEGCNPLESDIDFHRDMDVLHFELIRVSREASLQVRVEDAESGKIIAGASVSVAEAFPAGMIAAGKTDASGYVAFRDLKIGQLNWTDEKEGLTLSRGQCNVRAEAPGYEPAFEIVSLGENTTVTVALNPIGQIVELEPNNSLAEAQSIRTGSPIELKIDKIGDKDFFSFGLNHPSQIKISLGPACPIETYINVYDNKGNLITAHGAPLSQPNEITLNLQAGKYYVEVQEWGNNDASTELMTLKVSRLEAADALESNDQPETSRLLPVGGEVRGYIFPVGDSDYFHFELKRPGFVRLSMSSHDELQRYVALFDRSKKQVGASGVQPGQPLNYILQLPPGQYTIQITEWGNNHWSLKPYTLKLEVLGDDGIDDPVQQKDRMLAVRALSLNQLVGSTISPVGDHDYYTLAIPSRGELHLQFRSVGDLYVRILSPMGQELTGAGASAQYEQTGSVTRTFEGPAMVYLEVTEWGNNSWANSPYLLWAWFTPCGELDLISRNDTEETALPLELEERIRDSIFPLYDVDWYRLQINHAGYLNLEIETPLSLYFQILDPKDKLVFSNGMQPGSADWQFPILPGEHLLQVTEWGNNDRSPVSYAFTAALDRVDPAEMVPLKSDSIRELRLGHAAPYAIEHLDDSDRYRFNIPQAGEFFIHLQLPVPTYIWLFDDRTGETLWEGGQQPGYRTLRLEAKGPTRYRMELQEWGNNGSSMNQGWVMIDTLDRKINAEKITAQVDPYQPTLVTFARKPIEGLDSADKVFLDADGNGTVDLELPAGRAQQFRFSSEGVYSARVKFEAVNGSTAESFVWVDAVGPRERKGIRLVVYEPAQAQIVELDIPCRVQALSYTGARIARVSLAVDGKTVETSYSQPYQFSVPWSSLGEGEHLLSVTAVDAKGNRKTVERKVSLSEYFGLMPENGAVLSGDSIRVSWRGTSFGRAMVRYRLQGETDWKEVVGESGRNRVILLRDLEAGQTFEFQPIGAKEPGPIRKVTRVKGLAFGRSRYGANIERDYDQRLAISVRNHGEESMNVLLTCGKPGGDSKLLVGFVGEGSEGVPFSLGPGEEREFLLVMAAQDVVKSVHNFPVRITSEGSYADEAEVEVNVKLPVVNLEWELVGPVKDGLGQQFILHNKGDTLTDLQLNSSSPDLFVSPAISHGLFPAGRILEVIARPRLYEGFESLEAIMTAKGLDKEVSMPVTISLNPGQSVFQVHLIPGIDPLAGQTPEKDILIARTMAGALLDASLLDWSQKHGPHDVDGDGRPDRWYMEDRDSDILWVGKDTDGDGQIDFVHADIGSDGLFDYSAFKTEDGWKQTNIVEAWLEMGFSLPWARDQYEKHDIDIVMNGVMVGKLRDIIPEGNYRFRLPPTVINFGPDGRPVNNYIEIKSRHLRGGHYVVNTDFRIKLRLTATRVWVVATSSEEAERRARESEGLSMQGADYSVSSAEVRIEGPEELKKGDKVFVTVPLRNLGATRGPAVSVALVRAMPGQPGTELFRLVIEDPPLADELVLRLPWEVAAGKHILKIVVDPDQYVNETDRVNNEAVISLTVAGDDAEPMLKVLIPLDGATLEDPVFEIRAEATDDSGIAKVEVKIENGLWQILALSDADTYAAGGLLQPGPHILTVRATDSGGNHVEQKVSVTVEADKPRVEIVLPSQGASIDARQVMVRIRVPEDTVIAGVRVNRGPWQEISISNGAAEGSVDLTYGSYTIDFLVVNVQGVASVVSRQITCTMQPQPEQPTLQVTPTVGEEGLIDIANLGIVDAFGSLNVVSKDYRMTQGESEWEITRVLYRSTKAPYIYLEAEFSAAKVSAICTTAGGVILAKFSGPLNPVDESGEILVGSSTYQDGQTSGEVTYLFDGWGRWVNTQWTGEEEELFSIKWIVTGESGGIK